MPGQPIRLIPSDSSLAGLCETLEQRLASVSELNDLVFPVTLVANLDDLEEAQAAEALRKSPMAYLPRARQILVNASTLENVAEWLRPGTLAHEIGHGLLDQRPSAAPEVPAMQRDCIGADFLACRWGLHDEVRAYWSTIRGEAYCVILDRWRETEGFFKEMWDWYQQYLSRGASGR